MSVGVLVTSQKTVHVALVPQMKFSATSVKRVAMLQKIAQKRTLKM